jgi:ankyrin repeat protein
MELPGILGISAGAILFLFLVFLYIKGMRNSNSKRSEYENEKSKVKKDLELLAKSEDEQVLQNQGEQILLQAIHYNFDDVALSIINNKSDLEQTNEKGETALILAAKLGHLNIVKALIDHNANVNALNKNNVSALWSAAGNGFKGIVEILIQNKAHINQRDNIWGMTPLMRATQSGKYEVVKLLLKCSPDLSITAYNGDNVLDIAHNSVDKYWEAFKEDNADLRKMVYRVEQAVKPLKSKLSFGNEQTKQSAEKRKS